jgi:hypothetical protein
MPNPNYANEDGTWKNVNNCYVKHNGSWVEADEGWKNINGTWTKFYDKYSTTTTTAAPAARVALNIHAETGSGGSSSWHLGWDSLSDPDLEECACDTSSSSSTCNTPLVVYFNPNSFGVGSILYQGSTGDMTAYMAWDHDNSETPEYYVYDCDGDSNCEAAMSAASLPNSGILYLDWTGNGGVGDPCLYWASSCHAIIAGFSSVTCTTTTTTTEEPTTTTEEPTTTTEEPTTTTSTTTSTTPEPATTTTEDPGSEETTTTSFGGGGSLIAVTDCTSGTSYIIDDYNGMGPASQGEVVAWSEGAQGGGGDYHCGTVTSTSASGSSTGSLEMTGYFVDCAECNEYMGF